MTEHYDVIVIGTGAGGERWPTPWPPRASGSCCSSGVTSSRGRWRTGSPSRCSSTAATSRTTPGTTPTAQPFQPQVHYFVGGRRSCTAPRCTGCGPRTSARSSTSTASRRPGRSATTTSSPGTRRPSGSTRCTATTVRTRPRVTGRSSTRGPPVSHEPRIQEITDSLSAAGYHPFSAPCGILLDEADRARSTCIRCTWCDGYPCLVHAKSDAETIAVRPLLDAAERHAARRRGGRASSRPTRPAERSPTSSSSRGGVEERYEADIVVVAAGASNSAKLLLGSANDQPPERAGQRLRPGRPQLHVPQLQGGRRARQGTQRHRLPEDARHQRLLLRHRRRALAPREHPDGRQVQRLGDEGGEAEADDAGPALEPRRRRPARRRLLAHDRGPARPRQPGHGRRRRPHPPRLPVEQRRGGRPALRRAQEDPQPHRHGRAPRARARTST